MTTTMDQTRPRLGRLATVRARITLLATVAVAAILLLSAVGLVAAQQRLLTQGVDEALRQQADNLEPGLARGAYGVRLPSAGDPEDSFLQLLDGRGHVVAASVNAQAMAPAGAPLITGSPTSIRTVHDLTASEGDYRVLSRQIAGTDGAARTLVAGKNLDDVNESVRILTLLLAIAIPVVIVLLAVLVWWLTGRTLRQVESIRSEVADIGGTELHRRVPVPGTYDEVSRLAETMNEMLDRVEQATERERRFVADASHELRGPLTRIRSELELSLAHPNGRTPAEVDAAVLSDAIQLQELVDDLLFLARSQAGVIGPRADTVDLDDLLLAEARLLRDRGRVTVDTSAVSAARTFGDPQQLTRAIRNLASNAERHATSTVHFGCRELNGRSEVVVADDGPGIPERDRGIVFERFARLDQARSRDAGGTGLGLAIVADIVDRHAGAVTIATNAQDRGTRFVVWLPTAP